MTSEITAEQAARWQELDPLLPAPRPVPEPDADSTVLAVEAGAVAMARVSRVDPGSLDACWSALEAFQLSAARVGGPDPAAAMDALLTRWRDEIPAGAGPDSSAVLAWPSRDTAVAAACFRHGLAPMTVVAARPAGWPAPAASRHRAGLRIRRADPADAPAVAQLRLATIRYDAQFGVVTERPTTAARLGELSAQVLARDDPWTWLAERDGEVLGMIAIDQPPHADWMGWATAARPVGYVDCLGVRPDSRGSGIGGALLAHAHRALDAAGVAVTLLHHALPNPLSTPTYGRHGYRPLWTMWEARPATRLR